MPTDPLDKAWEALAAMHGAGSDGGPPARSAGERLGVAALRRGWITEDQLDEALEEQRVRHAEGGSPLLGQILVQRRWLSAAQVSELLSDQTLADSPDGLAIDRFVIQDTLGTGGMGRVYRAFDTKLKRAVALKVLHEGTQTDRLQREAQAAAKLVHPGIVSVFDVGEANGKSYLVMELVEGEVLDRAWRGWSWRLRVGIMEQVAQAMAYAHGQGVVHRDLKPGNVMVTAGGTAKVMDLGLARVVGATKLTVSGTIMGTPAYMAPEQVRGEETGPATDVYGLGTMLYEALTGTVPFDGEQVHQVYQKILTVDPEPPRSRDSKVPADLEVICLKAMEKEPGRRYVDAGELALELTRWRQGDPIRARPTSRYYRMRKRVMRNPWAWGTGAAAAVVVATTLVVAAVLAAGAARRQEAARSAHYAEMAYAVGAMEAAERHVRDALENDPENKDARYWLARLMLRRYQMERGLPEVRIRPGSIDLYLPADSPKSERAREEVRRAFAGKEGDALAEGVLLLWDGKFQQAPAKLGKVDPSDAGGWEAEFYSGQALYMLKRFDEAAEKLGRFAIREPHLFAPVTARAYLALAVDDGMHGKSPVRWFEAALTEAKQVTRGGDAVLGRRLQAAVLVAWGDWHHVHGETRQEMQARARECYEQSIGVLEDGGVIDIARAEALWGLDRLDSVGGKLGPDLFLRSIQAYTDIIEAEPRNVLARIGRGDVYVHRFGTLAFVGKADLEDLKRACADFSAAIELNADTPYGECLLVRAGRQLERASDAGVVRISYEREIEDLTDVGLRWPGSAIAHYLLGATLMEYAVYVGRLQEDPEPINRRAIEAFTRTLESDPRYTSALSARAVVYQNMSVLHADPATKRDLLRKALADLEAAVNVNPSDADAHCELGRVHLDLGLLLSAEDQDPTEEFHRARRCYDDALEIDPEYPEGTLYRGLVHLHLGWYHLSRGGHPGTWFDEGVEDYRKTLLKAEAYLRGLLRDRGGDALLRQALAWFEDKSAQEPTHPDSHFFRGVILRCLGRLDESELELRKALDLDPGLGPKIEPLLPTDF